MKNKKTIAFAMAAMSVAGTVVPSFAAVGNNEVIDRTDNLDNLNKGELQGRVRYPLSQGKKAVELPYEKVYDTKYTSTKEDDTLIEGIELLKVNEKATGNKGGKYFVAIPLTKEDLEGKNPKEEKAILDKLVKDINKKLNNEKRYELVAKEYKENTQNGDIELDVVLKDKRENKNIHYKFVNVPMGVSEYNTAKKYEFDLGTNSHYDFSKLIYNLEEISDKYTISQNRIDNDNLQLNIYKKDEDKKPLASITITNMLKLDTKFLKRIPGKNDFNGHWAEKTIFDAMYNGRVDISNNFRPNDGITRAEFVKVINKTFGLKDKAKKEYFADVEKGQWFYDDILVAVKSGYIKGYEDGTFRPNEKISRQEAAVIIARLNNGNEDVETKLPGGDIKTDYKDDKHIAVWADESVQVLKTAGIIKGYEDGTFRPKNNITRAEAVTMINSKGLIQPLS